VVAVGHRRLELPQLGFDLEQRSRAPDSAYLRSVIVELERRSLVVERDAHALLKRELAALDRRLTAIARRSVVLPAPLAPASERRSLRPTVKDTLSNRGSPANSLRSSDAMRTAMAAEG
jgi:hypothetical protein